MALRGLSLYLTFDTTASNTGHVSAACVAVQKNLDRALLWSACRHHVGEVILSHVFDDLHIEASKSPDVTIFTRFRKHFELLHSVNSTQDMNNAQLTRFDETAFSATARSLIDRCRASVLELAQSELLLRRDDYLEFVQLCVVFLSADEVATKKVTFKRPGALHKARWMAKLIYSIKICLFQSQIQQLPAGTITTTQQVSKVRDFANFVTLVYSKWWMSCNSAVDASWNDLQLFHDLLRYDVIHPEVSRSAVRAFKNHLWYLTEEMVPLALWSTKVSSAEHRALADRLLALKPVTALITPMNRFGTGFGKPKFPAQITLSTTLADLVGADSWLTFNILQLDPQFLVDDVESWTRSDAYQSSLENLRAVNVVNDCAERGVKLSSDFLASAKCEGHYQNILQVVEHDRKQNPNVRKRKTVST